MREGGEVLEACVRKGETGAWDEKVMWYLL